MALAPGTRLGPYEIVGPIGAGGMGEVYKARDTRLERTVAVKVLPPTVADDPEFKARLEREARSISALNHPHICTLFDVGEGTVPVREVGLSTQTVSYLVMEFLEGETLADRLRKGPLPVDQAIDLASQIADALDKAHRQGIVHRDLKPANVFLVRAVGASGAAHCKLLDFGLAKMGVATASGVIETRLAASIGATTQLPATAPLTSQGTILGTFQYMAPEQIEGHDADARTDIWAFGCVLYEMLTGKRAFEGKSQASLIASILERQPAPMAELQPMTPPALGRLVRTCLEKNPDNRFHTAHDLWLHLQWIEEGGSAAGLPAPIVAGRKRRGRVMWAGAALGLAAVAAAAAWRLKPTPPVTNIITRFSYPLPEGQSFTRVGRRIVAISPDGTKIAYVANNQLYLRQMGELDAQPIRGTDVDPLDPVFAPDGQSIAFFVPSSTGGSLESATLKRIATVGGAPVPLCPAGASYGARWQGDRIVFSLGDRILAVAETGGTPETLLKADAGVTETYAQPQLVGDGKTLLYTLRTSRPFNESQIVVQPIGGARRVLVEGGTDGRIVSTGHLLWVRDSTLFAQAVDLASLKLSGGPVPLVEGVRETNNSGAGQVGISDSGTLVYVPGTTAAASDLVWVDRAGREEPTGAPPKPYVYPRLSPDDTKVAVSTTQGDSDVWIWDFGHKTMTRLTSGPDVDLYVVWTPDGRSVIFRSGQSGGQIDLYRRAANGTGTLERLTQTPEAESPQMALSDGRLLIRSAGTDSAAQGTLLLLPPTPGAKPEKVFATLQAPQTSGEISPDRQWIAYQSAEGSTRDEIHVRPFPDTDAWHSQISSGGGGKPMWARLGRELFYHSGSPSRLMRVEVQAGRAGGPFVSGTPMPLLDTTKYIMAATGRPFDISHDGQRFLVIKPVGADDTAHQSLTVVTHWFDELRARVKGK
jgi:eukaryotic-like serine/threonine-protein kinase